MKRFAALFLIALLCAVSGAWAEENIPAEATLTQEESGDAGAKDDAVVPAEDRHGVFELVSFSYTPEAMNALDRQFAILTETIKERFALYLRRSGRYLKLMTEIITEKGLPEDIAFLPLIESGFSTHARSRAKAVGPWQFIASTARLYGLKINNWVDERRDPVKSTHAAAEYLLDLYRRFGSWDLAMAAYNAGEGKVGRALRRSKGEDFWDLIGTRYIKPETKNYVPKFMAARLIAENPAAFGFEDVAYEESFDYDTALIEGTVDISVLARCAGTTPEEIRELNPELLLWCTPPDVKEYALRVPPGTKETFLENFSKLPQNEKRILTAYTIKKGDTLSGISKKTGIPTDIIRALNPRAKDRSLRPGHVLLLPPSKGRARTSRS